ncbi:MAG: 30S ribosome-binding factor RbfA [Acidobacteriota bacterium]|nr:30S ribosome-binding factor RbfA [Acidobacteriota bacterium]
MALNSRPERVADSIREEITTLLTRSVQDPGIGFITITRVKVTADLQHARVFYTTIGDEKAKKETGKALERVKPFLRRQISQRIQLRRAPELEFFFDETIGQQQRIEELLLEVQAERREYELANPPEPEAPAVEAPGDAGPTRDDE